LVSVTFAFWRRWTSITDRQSPEYHKSTTIWNSMEGGIASQLVD
jgi:hypothetical protein